MSPGSDPSRPAQASSRVPGLAFSEPQIRRLFGVLDREGAFDPPGGEISVAFLPKDELTELHARFLDDPAPTDVITFPGDPDDGLAGEICLSPEAAWDYARQRGLPFAEELSLYLIHGYLHLCGFDDRDEAGRRAMRQAEAQALRLAKAAGALPRFEYRPA